MLWYVHLQGATSNTVRRPPEQRHRPFSNQAQSSRGPGLASPGAAGSLKIPLPLGKRSTTYSLDIISMTQLGFHAQVLAHLGPDLQLNINPLRLPEILGHS